MFPNDLLEASLMIAAGGFAATALLLHFAIASWIVTRRFGVAGMLAAQFCAIPTWTCVSLLANWTGEMEYDGASTWVSIFFDAFNYNLMLLPASMTAVLFNIAARRHSGTASTRMENGLREILHADE